MGLARTIATATTIALLGAGALSCLSILGIEDAVPRPEDARSETSSGEAATVESETTGETTADSCTPSLDDPENCGACGHDCLGGSCVEGRCHAALLVRDSVGEILSLTVDPEPEGRVYWSLYRSDGLAIIDRIDKNGAPASSLPVWSRKTLKRPTSITCIGNRLVGVLTDGVGGAHEGELFGIGVEGQDPTGRGFWERPIRVLADDGDIYWLNDGDVDIVVRASPLVGVSNQSTATTPTPAQWDAAWPSPCSLASAATSSFRARATSCASPNTGSTSAGWRGSLRAGWPSSGPISTPRRKPSCSNYPLAAARRRAPPAR